MKVRMFKIAAMMLMLAGSFASCSNKISDDKEEVPHPKTAILGKWELVLLTRNMGKDEIQHTPTGYVEYLPEGLMSWYDYTTKKHTLLESKYCLEEVSYVNVQGIPDSNWYVHYQNLWIELKDGTRSCIYPDFQGCENQACNFISNNRMGLYQLCTAPIIEDYTQIYKRKK